MQVAVITGGSRGIGAALVKLYAEKGYHVIFTYLKSEGKAQALCAQTGAAAIRCDAACEADVQALAELVKKRYHHADAVICNAGMAYSGMIDEMSAAKWDELFAVHVRGTFLMARAFLPLMRQGGSIVLMSSMWGQVGAACEVAYSACKAALIGMTKALAKEVAPAQIRVNCVAPGVIDTDMMAGYDAAAQAELCASTPLGRLGQPEDVAQTVYFITSDAAAFITGQVVAVNGGYVV